MAIVVDFSGTMHAAVFVDLKMSGLTTISKDMVRHTMLGQIRKLRQMFCAKYGPEMVLALDTGSWRRTVFPEYKCARATSRAASPYDWDSIFKTMGAITDEFRRFLPYHMIGFPGAEADDVVAVLAHARPWIPGGTSLMGSEPWERDKEMLIVSNDHDMRQLHRLNCSQWFPVKKSHEREDDCQWYLEANIIDGDPGDGIPNIRSPKNILKLQAESPKGRGPRQKPVSKKFIAGVLNGTVKLTPMEEERRALNRRLIDLMEMPKDIWAGVLKAWKVSKPARRDKLAQYMIANSLEKHMSRLSDF